MEKVYIATSRPKEIGTICINWALKNTPEGYTIVKTPEECNIFISVLYDTLIPEGFIEGRRCYNFHPGILPDYRGSGVYSWVLLNKESETGITLHEIDPDIDSGPIIEMAKTDIQYNDTAETLFTRSMFLLYGLFTSCYCRLLSGAYTTILNRGGSLYLRNELDEEKDVSHIIRAFDFQGKESAYWTDSQGIKNYIEWK
jgi:methionyl-tRNA formyltransferase